MAAFDIRPAGIEDAPRIAEMYVTTRRLAYATFYPAAALAALSIPEQTRLWQDRLADTEPRMQTLIATDGEALAAFVHFGRHGACADDEAEVEYLYVAAEYQRAGLGADLLARACQACRAGGLTSAFLWVYAANNPALAFYERQGWTNDGGRRESGSAPGNHLLRYRRQLR